MQHSDALPIVWVFNGTKSKFPSAVFVDQQDAEAWIQKNKLTGTLTAYPVNQDVYNWAIEQGHFAPKNDQQKTPEFIGNFSSASQEHFHYEAEDDAKVIEPTKNHTGD